MPEPPHAIVKPRANAAIKRGFECVGIVFMLPTETSNVHAERLILGSPEVFGATFKKM